eukprot:433672-Pyramimonas_sp.AAC.1
MPAQSTPVANPQSQPLNRNIPRSHGPRTLLQGEHERAEVGVPAGALLLGGHREIAEHGGNDAHARQPEGKSHLYRGGARDLS